MNETMKRELALRAAAVATMDELAAGSSSDVAEEHGLVAGRRMMAFLDEPVAMVDGERPIAFRRRVVRGSVG